MIVQCGDGIHLQTGLADEYSEMELEGKRRPGQEGHPVKPVKTGISPQPRQTFPDIEPDAIRLPGNGCALLRSRQGKLPK